MFKCFKFIDDLMRQLNEADENQLEENDASIEETSEDTETTDGEESSDGEEQSDEQKSEDVEETGISSEEDPTQIADVELGTFISPITKANWANMLLKFLRNKHPEIKIPTQYETVTTENADAIIEFVKNTDIIIDDTFGEELNGI